MHTFVRRGAGYGVMALSLVMAAACGPGEIPTVEAQSVTREQLGPPAPLDTITAARLSGAFRAAAERALPAVAAIEVVATSPRAVSSQQLPPGFEEFFRFPFDQSPTPRQGRGSGFVFDPRGYVMTNHHVIRDATRVEVRLSDGRVFEAEIVGGDPNTDVAVLKIEPRNGQALPVAELGNSEQLLVGDWVLALGTPLDLDFTVTAGIVSAKGRAIGILDQPAALEAFIQTDAAINPGNSGGPLVDLMGRVVGVNSAIASPTGSYAGYGFAIPIEVARRVASDLIEHGVVRRPRLGVSVSNVTADDAEVYGLPEIAGAHVGSVQQDSPAEEAGIRMGDVILEVDGRPVRNASALITTLAQRQPGDRVRLTVFRDGQRRTIEVTLDQFETPEVAQTSEPRARRGAAQVLGFQARVTRDGVAIAQVVPGSPAAARGLQPGMIIVSINGQSIRTQADLDRVVSDLDSGDIVSIVVRDPGSGAESIRNYRVR